MHDHMLPSDNIMQYVTVLVHRIFASARSTHLSETKNIHKLSQYENVIDLQHEAVKVRPVTRIPRPIGR